MGQEERRPLRRPTNRRAQSRAAWMPLRQGAFNGTVSRSLRALPHASGQSQLRGAAWRCGSAGIVQHAEERRDAACRGARRRNSEERRGAVSAAAYFCGHLLRKRRALLEGVEPALVLGSRSCGRKSLRAQRNACCADLVNGRVHAVLRAGRVVVCGAARGTALRRVYLRRQRVQRVQSAERAGGCATHSGWGRCRCRRRDGQ